MEFLIFVVVVYLFFLLNPKVKEIVDVNLDTMHQASVMANESLKRDIQEQKEEDILKYLDTLDSSEKKDTTNNPTTNIYNHQENTYINNYYIQNTKTNYKNDREDELHTYDDWKDLGYQVMKGEKSSHRVRNTAGFTREQVIKKDYYLN